MSKVSVNAAKSKIGETYAGGCTGFVGSLLGQPQKHSSHWKRGNAVKEGDLSPGDVIGWGGSGEAGHVGVYVGEEGCKFVDCPEPGGKVRKLNSYGPKQLHRMSY